MECPPLKSKKDLLALGDRMVLVVFDDDTHRGWLIGKVKKNSWPSATDKRKAENDSLNLVVRFSSARTGGVLDAVLAQELSAEKYGAEEGWVLLQDV